MTIKSSPHITIAARAPGKIILSGEHSVVYAKPALAMAVNRFAETTISQINESKFQFAWVNEKIIRETNLKDLKLLQTNIDKRYQDFTHGKYNIRNVIHEPLELLQYAFIYLAENLSLPIKSGLKIQVQLNLPTGCGMGSSAAVILSLMHALVNHFGVSLTLDKYLYLGREIENLQHGKSSGLDLFLSLHGGCHFFIDGNTKKREMPNIPLLLVNTGKPKTSTGECVETVTKHFQNSDLADDFAETTMIMDLALQQNNLPALQECIRENHKLLKYIGVVPNKVNQFIAAIEARGNAAKISGAGAMSGDTAGIVLIVGTASILDLVKEYGYEILRVKGEPNGLQII